MAKLSRTVAKAGQGRVISAPRRVGPVATLDMGRFGTLKSVPPAERKPHLNTLDKVARFDQLRLSADLRARIAAGVLKSPEMPPTPVQKVAIKALLRHSDGERRDWLIAAETGSGKTLAYLAPLIMKLSSASEPRNANVRTDKFAETTSSRNPANIDPTTTPPQGPLIRSIVLVPTLDLAHQVIRTVRTLAPSLRSALVAGLQDTPTVWAKQVARGVDLAVATPDKLLRLAAKSPRLYERALAGCEQVVVDEADSLLHTSFNGSTQKLLRQTPHVRDVVLVSATIPAWFDKTLRTDFQEATRLVTPSIHRLPRNIEFKVVEVARRPYHNNKRLALEQALYAVLHDHSEAGLVKRVLVFVNQRKDVDGMVQDLRKAGYWATGVDQVGKDGERPVLKRFMRAREASEASDASSSQQSTEVKSQHVKSQEATSEAPDAAQPATQGRLEVLVATDLLARGVDFHKIRTIILYDMPHSAADLLHRAGRTGRLGTKGRVLLFVSRGEEKAWVRGLETVVKRGMALA